MQGGIRPFEPRVKGQAMSNAERQARWRAKHRPAKPALQWGPDGRVMSPQELLGPNATAPIAAPATTVTQSITPAIGPAAPPLKQNYCPHCGSCLRKRAKAAKLAA